MPAPQHSVFTGRVPFLPPNQQRQSNEGSQNVNPSEKKSTEKVDANSCYLPSSDRLETTGPADLRRRWGGVADESRDRDFRPITSSPGRDVISWPRLSASRLVAV